MAELDHLLFSEIVLTPSDGEYVRITNPTNGDIDLTNYYLTDGTDLANGKVYYKLPEGADYWSGSGSDFICRFPDGFSLSAGSSIYISLRDSSKYASTYGENADLTLIDDMRDAVDGISTKGASGLPKLDNTNETLILFYWDGTSSEIKDVEYLLWGDNFHGVDKSDISGYLADTPMSSQSFMTAHLTDEKLVRISDEGSEIQTGGNGITGHDETSENLSETWEVRSVISSKPQISNVVVIPQSPTIEDEIIISAIVVDDESVLVVELITTFEGNTTVSDMALIGSDQYSLSLVPFGVSGELIYYIRAEDNVGLKDSTNIFSITISELQEPPTELSIKDLLDNLDDYVGTEIEIDGIIAVPAGKLRTNFTEAFLQDESERGIILYNSSLDTSFHRGDSVLVVAEVDEFDGKPELIYSSITVLKENAHIPVVEISIAEFNSLDYTYAFVQVWGKVISRSDPSGTNTGANISLQDASGEVTTVRIWNSTNILYNDNFELVNPELDSLLQVGNIIEVAGVGGEYSGASQLQPAYREDITEKLEGEVGDFEAKLDVAPYPFVPQLGEVIAYTYSFPANGRIKLRVFDMVGRLITTLYDEYRGISFYKEATWDGRDHLNRLVSPGTYIFHLDVTDAITGNKYQDMAPVVIGVYGN
jgi:hypothetical protein|tara:strand:+ start:5363 stop:7312 length:1950 start_codon:yes stop_codon:yes gene_type:complete